MIKLNNVAFHYVTYSKSEGLLGTFKDFKKRDQKRVSALSSVSLEIKKGEIVGLLGPNGAGKTTLMKLLAGILEPSEGELSCDGFRPFDKNKAFLSELGVVMGQKSQLIWDLPAAETLLMLKVIYKITEEDYRKRLEEMTALLKVKEKLNTPVRKLSLGERIKFELICALIHQPKLLFLDEPTIGLDIMSQRSIHEFLLKINQLYETTILLTSHYMKDIEALTDRLLILMDGKLIEDTSIAELKAKFQVDETFLVHFSDEIPEQLQNYKQLEKGQILVPLEEMKAFLDKVNDFRKINLISKNTPSFEEIIFDIFKELR